MSSFASRKILLVDDDDELRRVYTSHLMSHGFTVEEATDTGGAQKSFRSIRPDLAILDFQLSDGTALDLVSSFKELEPSVPIIVLTGFGSMELGVSLIKKGVEQCLSKPIEASALLMMARTSQPSERVWW